MPDRQKFIDQVKGAERECQVVAAAVVRYQSMIRSGELNLPVKTSPRDLEAAAEQVETTYLIRMWAAFEMGIRSYDWVLTGHDTIRAKDLLDWTAGVKRGRAISETVRDQVHEVRDYRNFLIHGKLSPPVLIEDARKRLYTMLHCLPHRCEVGSLKSMPVSRTAGWLRQVASSQSPSPTFPRD